MLELKEIRVRSLDTDQNEITWKLEDTSEDIFDYNFAVQRSESPEGPWDAISVTFQDRYTFVDNVIKSGHRYRKYFYRILVSYIPSPGTSKIFGPESKDPDADLIALELRRHMLLLFSEFTGRRCWVLPVRTFGQRCSCYNDTLKQKRSSGCRVCFDTGFVRGYLHPIETWIQVDPSPKTEQNTNVGAQQQSNTTALLAWYPPLKPRDLIVEPENRRWRVVQVNQTEQGRAAVHQQVQMHEVPPRDVEYAIPLITDQPLSSLWLNPSRNYTNPMTLESFMDSEAPGVISLFQPKVPT